MITFTPKEQSLLRDLTAQEQICVEKYSKYAADACDGGLKNLFTAIAQAEQKHLDTLNQISTGTVPQMGGGGAKPAAPAQPAPYQEAERQQDAFLCKDALSTEKYVSGAYDTSIFEFTDTAVRSALNHMQKEEQEHGQQLYQFMAANNLYQGS